MLHFLHNKNETIKVTYSGRTICDYNWQKEGKEWCLFILYLFMESTRTISMCIH